MTIDFTAWESYRVIWLRVGAGRREAEDGPAWFEPIEAHCRTHGQNLAWISLHPADDDPQRFVRVVIMAVYQALGLPAELAVHSEPEDYLVLWIHLVNQISELERLLVLALEGYDQIEHPGVHELVAELLEYQPRALQILLICRAAPPLPLPRLRARRALLEVGPIWDG